MARSEEVARPWISYAPASSAEAGRQERAAFARSVWPAIQERQPALDPLATPAEGLAVCQFARDADVVPPEAALYTIHCALEELITDGHLASLHGTDLTLRRAQLGLQWRRFGLPRREPPWPGWNRLPEGAQAYYEEYAAAARRHGELELAERILTRPGHLNDELERGRRWVNAEIRRWLASEPE